MSVLQASPIKKVNISAIIITKNEERNIARCLESLLWVDEIIIIDSYSTDKTIEVALSYEKVRLFSAEWKGFSENKRKALHHCTHHWIFWLDADEEVTYELQQEILALTPEYLSQYDAFTIPRKTYFMGEYARIFYPSRSGRLFDKNKCGFNDKVVHEGLLIHDKSRLGHLNSVLNHFSFSTLEQYFSKMNFYGKYGAEELIKKNKIMGKWRLLASPLFTFFKYYVLEGGFLDRKFGLIVSLGNTYANFIKYTHYYFLIKERKRSNLRESISHQSVIISRTDNIGDVLLTLPMAAELKEQIPGIKIIFLGKRYTEELVRSSSLVDHFVAVEDVREGKLSLNSLNAKAIVFAYPDRFVAYNAWKDKIQWRIGTSHRWYNTLFCNKLVDLGRRRSHLHEMQLNLQLLEMLGINEHFDLYTLVSKYGLQPKAHIPEEIASLFDISKFVLIIHPKSRGSAREWPLEKYRQLVDTLSPNRYSILVTGTEAEGKLIKNSGFWNGITSNVHDLTGKLSLSQLISVIALADGLLACSTGPLHIAAANGIYTLGLYPPMKPIHAGRWAPIGINADYITVNKSCNDCRKTMNCICLQSISVEEVLNHIVRWSKKSDERAAV